jgi:hypothetical protein
MWVLGQIPCRSGSPHGVRGIVYFFGAGFAAGLDVYPAIVAVARPTMEIAANTLIAPTYRLLIPKF